MNRVEASTLAALAAVPLCAYLGDRAVAVAMTCAEPLDGALEAMYGTLPDVLVDPFFVSLDPYALIGAIAGAVLPLAALAWWLMNASLENRKGEVHGSNELVDPRSLAGFAEEGNPDPVTGTLRLTEHVGLALERKGFSRRYDRNLNVLVIGGSGAGKTRYYVKPNVAQMSSDMFITDPKGDLVYDVGGMLTENTYDLRCFNTFRPDLSLNYNMLYYVHTDLDVLSFAHMLVAMTEEPGKTGGDPFWTKSEIMLYSALTSYLIEYGDEEDVSIEGMLQLLDLAGASEDNENYESGLDLIFAEIETGMKRVELEPNRPRRAVRADGRKATRVVPASAGRRFAQQPSRLRRRSDGKMPFMNVHADGQRGFEPKEDFSLRNYKNFKQAAGKTLKSIIISCNVRLAPFTAAEVRAITSGPDQMHLERLGGERTGTYRAITRAGDVRRVELTDREAALMRADGTVLEPYYRYRLGESSLARSKRRLLERARTDEEAAQEVLEARALQMRANCGLLDPADLDRARELGVEVPDLDEMRAHNEGLGGKQPAGADAVPASPGRQSAPGVLGLGEAARRYLERGHRRRCAASAPAAGGVAVLTRDEARARGLDDADRIDDRPAPGEPRLDTKNVIFAIFKDTDQRTLGFLHGMMVYQAVNVLCQKALDDFGGRLPRCVNFILDEYRSLSLPEDISAMISVVRSRNIAMSIILQGISQLGELYKPDAAKSIRACCDSTLFLGSTEEDTLKYMSELLGNQTVYDVNYSSSHGQGGSWTRTQSKSQRKLMEQDEIARLDNSKAILQIRAANPTIDDKIHLEETPRYREMDGSRPFDLLGYQRARAVRADAEEARLRKAGKTAPRRTAEQRSASRALRADTAKPRRRRPPQG